MKRVLTKFIKIIAIYLLIMSSVFAEKLIVFDFTEEELNSLEVRKVRGADAKTVYSIGNNENGNYLKAVAANAASGVGKEIKINLDKTCLLYTSPSPRDRSLSRMPSSA